MNLFLPPLFRVSHHRYDARTERDLLTGTRCRPDAPFRARAVRPGRRGGCVDTLRLDATEVLSDCQSNTTSTHQRDQWSVGGDGPTVTVPLTERAGLGWDQESPPMPPIRTHVPVLVISVLLVTSVFAGTALTGPAAALFTGDVTADSASNVQAFRTAATQTLTATVTITNGSADNTVTFTTPAGNIVGANGVSVSNPNVTASGLSVDSRTQVTVDLADTNATDGADETTQVTLTVTHNLANVAPASGLDATVSAGGRSDTTQFDVVRYLGPTGTIGRVFLGDRDVDLTGLASAPGSGSVTLFGVAGEADGGVATVSDVRRADITDANNFEPGAYSFESDGTADLSVVEPRITEVTVYRGDGTDGADITGGSIPSSIGTITVQVEFNFAEAEDASVFVDDEDGLDITRQLTDRNRISRSGGTVVLRNIDELDAGQYTIVVEGSDDLDFVRTRVGAGIRDETQSITLEETEVTQGQEIIATVAGTPGEYGLVRIAGSDLDGIPPTDETAARVFRATGDVETRRGTNTLGGTDDAYVGAVVDLGDDGIARVRIDTAFLDPTTVDVEFVELAEPNTDVVTLRDGFDADADDTAELDIEEREIRLSATPTVVRIGEEFTITGVAPQSDDVKAYARIDSEWVPLRDGDGDLAEDDVDSRGRFSIEVDAGREINFPDAYRIAVVADPVAGGTDYLGSEASLTTSAFGDFDTTATTTVRTVEGALTSSLSAARIAADTGDEVTLSGTSFGQGDSVRVYLIGPRGQFLTADGGFGAESVSVRDNEFEAEYDAFQQRGGYTFFVVGRGRDGEYASDIGFGGADLRRGLTPQQAVEIIRDEYSGAGVDDRVIELTLSAENPSLAVDDFTQDGQVAQGEVTISGTSNRQDGTVIFVEVFDADNDVVATAEAVVDGASGEWETTLDLADLETGAYQLRASDDETAARLEFEVVSEVTTPTETPAETPVPTETPTMTPTASPTPTATPTEAPTTTATEFPGFGPLVALLALVAAALLAARRRRS